MICSNNIIADLGNEKKIQTWLIGINENERKNMVYVNKYYKMRSHESIQ